MKNDEDRLKLEYQDDVKDFLIKLGFEDVNKDGDLTLNGKYPIKLDAVGGYGDTLLVIEVKTKQQLGRGGENFGLYLIKFQTDAEEIKKRLMEEKKYKKYKKYKFLMITKNIEYSEKVIEQAAKTNIQKIFLRDDDFIRYYRNLYEVIGKFAKYSLLSELDVKKSGNKTLVVPAIKSEWKDKSVYTFFANPKDLLEISYVARREVKQEQYYQRVLKPSRVRDIKENFIDNADELGFFPNNVIVSINESSEFKPLENITDKKLGKSMNGKLEFGFLILPDKFTSLWIIDGQHRLFAYGKSIEEENVPVVAFDNLSLVNQAKFFLKINEKQKKVEPDLLWDLKSELIPDERDGKISSVCKDLIGDSKSPIFQMFYVPSLGPRKRFLFDNERIPQLSFTTLCKTIQRKHIADIKLFPRKLNIANPLFDTSHEEHRKKLKAGLEKFFNSLEKIFGKHPAKNFIWTGGKSGGFAVMIGFYERILARCNTKVTSDEIEKYLKGLREVFNEEYTEDKLDVLPSKTTSFGNQDRLIDELTKKTSWILNDSEFAKKIEEVGEGRIRDLEWALGKVIKFYGSSAKDGNWKSIIPEVTLRYITKRANDDKSEKPEEYINMGQIREMFEKNPNTYEIFKKFFEGTESRFTNKNELITALDIIMRKRVSKDYHKKTDGINIKCFKIDEKVETFINQLLNIIEENEIQNKDFKDFMNSEKYVEKEDEGEEEIEEE